MLVLGVGRSFNVTPVPANKGVGQQEEEAEGVSDVSHKGSILKKKGGKPFCLN